MPIALALLKYWLDSKKKHSKPAVELKADQSTVSGSPVASGSGITQNSHNVSLTVPFVPSSAPGRERADEWRELRDELHEALVQIGYAFIPLNAIRPGDERNDYQAGIRRGNRVISNRLFIADVLKRERISERFEELVRYAISARSPREPDQRGAATETGFDMRSRAFEDELLEIARKDIAASGASPKSEQTKTSVEPNVVYDGSEQRQVFIGPWEFQGIADPKSEDEREKAVPALLMRFENCVLRDRKIARARSVIAKLKFLSPNGASVSERSVDYGVWLNARSNGTSMEPGDTQSLVLMCFVNDQLLSFRDLRVENSHFSEGFGYLADLDVSKFDRVEITIIDQASQTHMIGLFKYSYKDETFYISEISQTA
jgi:hypothetical protein